MNTETLTVSECAMGSFALMLVDMIWTHTRKEILRKIYTTGHAQTPCKAMCGAMDWG